MAISHERKNIFQICFDFLKVNVTKQNRIKFRMLTSETGAPTWEEVESSVDGDSDSDSDHLESMHDFSSYSSDTDHDQFSDSSDDYYRDDGAGGPVTDDIHDYIDGSVRTNPEYALIYYRVPTSGLAVDLVCSEDTYVPTEPSIKILDYYIGLLMSNSAYDVTETPYTDITTWHT